MIETHGDRIIRDLIPFMRLADRHGAGGNDSQRLVPSQVLDQFSSQ
jgi:hypothetical protein